MKQDLFPNTDKHSNPFDFKKQGQAPEEKYSVDTFKNFDFNFLSLLPKDMKETYLLAANLPESVNVLIRNTTSYTEYKPKPNESNSNSNNNNTQISQNNNQTRSQTYQKLSNENSSITLFTDNSLELGNVMSSRRGLINKKDALPFNQDSPFFQLKGFEVLDKIGEDCFKLAVTAFHTKLKYADSNENFRVFITNILYVAITKLIGNSSFDKLSTIYSKMIIQKENQDLQFLKNNSFDKTYDMAEIHGTDLLVHFKNALERKAENTTMSWKSIIMSETMDKYFGLFSMCLKIQKDITFNIPFSVKTPMLSCVGHEVSERIVMSQLVGLQWIMNLSNNPLVGDEMSSTSVANYNDRNKASVKLYKCIDPFVWITIYRENNDMIKSRVKMHMQLYNKLFSTGFTNPQSEFTNRVSYTKKLVGAKLMLKQKKDILLRRAPKNTKKVSYNFTAELSEDIEEFEKLKNVLKN